MHCHHRIQMGHISKVNGLQELIIIPKTQHTQTQRMLYLQTIKFIMRSLILARPAQLGSTSSQELTLTGKFIG